jgi:hypothetical protein
MNRRISNKEFRISKEGIFSINLPPFIIHYSLFDIRYSNKNQLLAARTCLNRGISNKEFRISKEGAKAGQPPAMVKENFLLNRKMSCRIVHGHQVIVLNPPLAGPGQGLMPGTKFVRKVNDRAKSIGLAPQSGEHREKGGRRQRVCLPAFREHNISWQRAGKARLDNSDHGENPPCTK